MKKPAARQMLFVYQTLRQAMTQKRAMGHATTGRPAVLPGWDEIFVGDGDTLKTKWPTIVQAEDMAVKGVILYVNVEDLKKLDNWEDHYDRKRVPTSAGMAWTYVYRGKRLDHAHGEGPRPSARPSPG